MPLTTKEIGDCTAREIRRACLENDLCDSCPFHNPDGPNEFCDVTTMTEEDLRREITIKADGNHSIEWEEEASPW